MIVMAIHGLAQSDTISDHVTCTFPAEVEQGEALPSFSSHAVNSYPFHSLYSAMFFSFFCFLWVTSLFKINPKHSFEVLPFVPKYNRVVMEQIHVLGKLLSGISYSAVGCELNANESTIHIK